MRRGAASGRGVPDLNGMRVLLSASFPAGPRADKVAPANPFEITSAVVAVSRAVLGHGGCLLFGGHPTIAPLLLSLAREHAVDKPGRQLVKIYQSEWFKDVIPEETRELLSMPSVQSTWVPRDGDDRGRSLLSMRAHMLSGGQPIAGVFIGGMDGVYSRQASDSEFALFKRLRPGRPVYPIGQPGGAALDLVNDMAGGVAKLDWTYPPELLSDLSCSRLYYPLTNAILADIGGSRAAR